MPKRKWGLTFIKKKVLNREASSTRKWGSKFDRSTLETESDSSSTEANSDGGTTETYSCGSSTEVYSDEEVTADESREKCCPSIIYSSTSCQNCETILNWSNDSLRADFFENFACWIRSGFLKKGNTAFLLFEELLRKLAKPNNFNYSETTLLIWLSHRNMFGDRYLWNMAGNNNNQNFAAPSQITLQSICSSAIKSQRP